MPAVRRLRDIGAEAVLIVGGGRAILLQIADPAIGHAVAEHSDFVAQPVRRLEHTLAYVYTLVYGTPEQVATVRAMVDRAHVPVGARAVDPHLQLWVAATLYETATALHTRVIGPLDDASADAVYQDYAVVGTALQVPSELWPADRAAFAVYWHARLAALAPDDTARRVARDLLHPRSGPLWLRVSMPLARLVTAGLLPPTVRSEFGLPWSPARARRFELALTTIGAVNRVLPRRVREWPRDRLLRSVPGGAERGRD